MKPQKYKFPLIILSSVAVCVIIAVFSIILIDCADDSMMLDKIDEHKTSMQQAAANVQKDFDTKSEFISSAGASLSAPKNSFDKLTDKKSKKLKKLRKLEESGGFDHLLISDLSGNAFDADGAKFTVNDTDLLAKSAAGHSGLAFKAKSDVMPDAGNTFVYYAPVTDGSETIAVLLGFVPAVLNVSDYTEYAPNPHSGMYILDRSGNLVVTSQTAKGGSFYDLVKDNPFAGGADSLYRAVETRTEVEVGEGDEMQKVQKSTIDYYAGEITNSRSFWRMLRDSENTTGIYYKKKLTTNDWTLFYVRSVDLSKSNVTFLILCRALLIGIVAIFLAAMTVTLLIHARNSSQITSIACMDEVTGRFNWQKFVAVSNSRLSQKSWWKSKHAVLCININRFTIYNDYYGHKTGDCLLKYTADTLGQMCSSREYSTRRSGDIFAALWSYSSVNELNRRIDDLFSRIKDGPNCENVTLTVGVYLLTEEDKDVIHAADMARIAEETVEDAKVNTVAYFDEKIRAAMTEEHELEKMMQSALENDEFKLFIQPKHRVTDGALGGAEALVRWISPQKGFISPGKFIPLFEKNGFVGPVDNYILEQLCIFQRNRLRKGYKTVPISVNVSRVQLSDPNLASEICRIVDKHSVPHKYIDIELTESACFDDMNMLINTIHTLRSMGFPVSMDDFGSGYSSLNLLKELPFDTLKIDGEFFRNVTDENRANIVVKNIIDLAKSLNMTVVAEGIEKQEQVDFLKTTECDLIQGYFYSKPISAKDFEEYMTNHRIENK